MEILETFKSKVLKRRSASCAALVAAIAALLVVVAPVSAETTNGGIATPIDAVQSEAVQSPAPVEQVETLANEAAPPPEPVAPVEPQKVTDAIASVRTAVEDSPAAVASSPVAKTPAQVAASPAAALVDSVAGAASSADPAGSEPLATVAPSSGHRPLGRLVDNVRRGSATAVESARQGAVGAIAPVTARLPADPAFVVADLLDPIGSVPAETLLPAGGPLPAAGQPAIVVPPSIPAQSQAGLFSLLGVIASDGEPKVENPTLAEFRKVASAGRTADRPSDGREASALVMPGSEAGFSARINHFGGSPAPLDIPLPAPQSPKAVAPPGSGDSFFPTVALLALLALVAPAIPRRLAEGPGFRPPTPFVCALERPG